MIRLPLKPCCPYDQAVVRSAREGYNTTLDLVGVVISNRGQLTHADNMMTSLALAGSLFAEASLIQGAPLPWHIRQKPVGSAPLLLFLDARAAPALFTGPVARIRDKSAGPLRTVGIHLPWCVVVSTHGSLTT
jgi:hypothetical protein